MDIRNKVAREDIENAKIDRERITKPPTKFEPADDFDIFDDDIDSPSSGGLQIPMPSPSLGGMPPLPPMGGGLPPMGGGLPPLGGGLPPLGGMPPMGGGLPPLGGGLPPLGGLPPMGMGGMGMPNGAQQPPQKQSAFSDEKLEEYAVKSAKEAFSYFKDFIESFKHYNALQGADMFRNTAILGGVYSVLILILWILGYAQFTSLYVGIFTIALGVIGFGISYSQLDDSKDLIHPSTLSDGGNTQQQPPQPPNPFEANNPMSNPFPPMSSTPTFNIDDDFEDDTEEDDFDDDFDEDDEELEADWDDDIPSLDDLDDGEEPIVAPVTVVDNSKSEIDRIVEAITSSTVMSRENLYNAYMQVLPHETPTFSDMTVISQSSEEFDIWDACIKKAANIFRPSNGTDKEMPHLLEAKKNMFYTYLIVSRTVWVKKVEAFIDEFVRLIALDEKTGRLKDNIIGIGELSGDRMYIKIIENQPTIISLADVMKVNREFFCNPKNEMPVALGVSEEGEVLLEDFKGINTLLTTGMPRSGKTASVKSIITQLAMFNPPSQVQFIILDPKEGASDFKNYDLPHVRVFKTSDNDVIKELEKVITVEGGKRQKKFAEVGVAKIQDYNALRPDDKMPFLYVVIDEVITLAERMDADTKKAFQKNLNIIVSLMPTFGIRVFMIPHVVKDNIISKTTTDLIPCRISVCGSPKHVEAVTGATPNEFKYKLANMGDMALRLFQRDVRYARGVLYARDLGERKVLDFIRDLWVKIEPESYKGSYAEIYARERAIIDQNLNGGVQSGEGSIPTPLTISPKVGAIAVDPSVNKQPVLTPDTMESILKKKDDNMADFL